jgi:transcriptional regulator with XRE-family HTH domain
MTRIERLRNAMNWTQPRMAEYLGVRQATVSRLENGQAESGPISRLLDQLEVSVREAAGVDPSSLPSVPERRASQPNTDHPRGSEGPCPEAGSPVSGPFVSEAVP